MSARRGGRRLGLPNTSDMNLALLPKLVWRIITNPEGLLSTPKVANESAIWKEARAGLDFLKNKICWSVGEGDSIRLGVKFIGSVWYDPCYVDLLRLFVMLS